MKKYIVLSAVLHLSVLLISVRHGKLSFDQKGKGNGTNRYGGVTINKEVIPKNKESTEVEVIEKHPEIRIKRKKNKKVDKDCPSHWYGGIGIETVYRGKELIDIVHSGYPADLAGLLPGDEIVSVEGNYIPGPPETTDSILIRRNGKSKVYTITRGKICY